MLTQIRLAISGILQIDTYINYRGDWKLSERLQINGQASYTDYQRRTQTTILDLTTDRRTLSLWQGEQDVAKFAQPNVSRNGFL